MTTYFNRLIKWILSIAIVFNGVLLLDSNKAHAKTQTLGGLNIGASVLDLSGFSEPWTVISHDHFGDDHTLLWLEGVLPEKRSFKAYPGIEYNEENDAIWTPTTWEDSDIRAYLRGEFYQSLSPGFRDRIQLATTQSGKLTMDESQKTNEDETVFLLSQSELFADGSDLLHGDHGSHISGIDDFRYCPNKCTTRSRAIHGDGTDGSAYRVRIFGNGYHNHEYMFDKLSIKPAVNLHPDTPVFGPYEYYKGEEVYTLFAPPVITTKYRDFSYLGNEYNSEIRLSGSAEVEHGLLFLTVSADQVGGAFLENPISLANRRSFSTFFSFSMARTTGTDGFAFVINTDKNVASNQSGSNLGFKDIGSHSVGITFDTTCNSAWDSAKTGCNPGDQNQDFVGVVIGGEMDLVAGKKIGDEPVFGTDTFKDMGTWYAWIDYDGIGKKLEIRLNLSGSRPAAPFLTLAGLDLNELLDKDEAFVGFAAATSDNALYQDIQSFYFNNNYTPLKHSIYEQADGDDWGDLSVEVASGGAVIENHVTASGGANAAERIVYYSATSGSLDKMMALTDSDGIASVTLASSSPGTVTVKAILANGTYKEIPIVFALPDMGGTVSVNGTAKYGETLTANISGVTYEPETGDDQPTYQWKRGGDAINGATGASYKLVQEDIGEVITVTVIADGVNATGSVTSLDTEVVAKADGPSAPDAPTLLSKTTRSITLTAAAGREYSIDNGTTWQDSEAFSGLTPKTNYTFVTRVKATATHEASATSAGTTIQTDALPVMGGTVSIDGTAKYGETLTANLSGVTYTPSMSDDVPTYRWKRDGAVITGATNASYTLASEDIGQKISVTVTADGTHATGSVTSAETAATTKADGPSAPDAPTLTSKTTRNITLTAAVGQEYSIDNGTTWQDSEVFSGLTPNKSYTFVTRVKATATHEASTTSPGTTILTDRVNDQTAPVSPVAPPNDQKTDGDEQGTFVDLLVNGQVVNAGTATTETVNNQQVTTIVVDPDRLEQRLSEEGQGAVISIPGLNSSDVVIGKLTGQMVKNMEHQEAVVEIITEKASYTLPAQQINIDEVAKQFGAVITLQDIEVQIEIATSTEEQVQLIETMAGIGEFAIVAPPLNFSVKAVYGDKTVEISAFNAYVERMVALPEGVDPSKITTAVVIEPDGAIRHVPTKVVVVNGKYFSIINSLTNSTYILIWNPLEFQDTAGHWAEEAINNMGARKIVSGVGDEVYKPDQNITRAEFAAIIVRALGLKIQDGATPFSDVKPSDWYRGAIQTAYAHNLVNGYDDGTFRPTDTLTREQAMVMIAKAMGITKLKVNLVDIPQEQLLNSFNDANHVSNWAKSSVASSLQAGIVFGKSETKLAPKDYITRAEVAVFVQRLLKQSKLIN